MPIQIPAETVKSVEDRLPEFMRAIQTSYRKRTLVRLEPISVPITAKNPWSSKPTDSMYLSVRVAPYPRSKGKGKGAHGGYGARGKSPKTTRGDYNPDTKTVTVYADRNADAQRNDIFEILMHEIAHAIDLRHKGAIDLTSGGIPLPHNIRLTNDAGVVETVDLLNAVMERAAYVRSLIKAEAFPGSLQTREDRVRYIADAIVKDLARRGVFKLNKTVDPRKLYDNVRGIVSYKGVTRRLLDKEIDYIRDPSEIRAFTQTVLAEIRNFLKRGRCGTMSHLPESGVWGPKCTNLYLELSPTFHRLERGLTEEQRRRVLSDLSKLIHREFFKKSEDVPKAGTGRRALDFFADKIISETVEAATREIVQEHGRWTGDAVEGFSIDRAVKIAIASPTYAKVSQTLGAEDRGRLLDFAAYQAKIRLLNAVKGK